MSVYKQIEDRLLGFAGELPLVRHATNWVLGSGATIFTFHRVLPRGKHCFDPELCTSEDSFSAFLDWMQTNYQIVPLNEAISRSGKPLRQKRPECAITFDDGWLDNFECAFPHLRRRGLPATIFLPTRFIGTNRRFWQERLQFCTKELKSREDGLEVIQKVARRLPWFPPTDADLTSYGALKRLLLSRPSTEAEDFTQRIAEGAGLDEALADRAFINWDEVKQMQAGGLQFGSHTLSHTLLPNAPPRRSDQEIEESREELKAKIGEDPAGFSYPWGAVGPSSLAQVRRTGYEFAVTTRPGLVRNDCDPFLVPRVAISDSVLDGGKRAFSPGKVRLSFTKNILEGSSKQRSAPTKRRGNKRIKILFVLDLITEWEGGTERQLRLLIQALDQRYFEPKLCFLFDAPELAEDSLPCPLIVVCPRSKRVPPVPLRLWRLIQVFRDERPDIVQCFFMEGLMLGILAGRIAKVPQVVGSARNAGYWRNFTHRFVMKGITQLAHRWQTNSRTLWSFQRDHEAVSADLIEILPNGTDFSKFELTTRDKHQRAREKLGLTVDGPICVSVANLSRIKDLGTLIYAAKLLLGRLPTVQFILVGEGPEREALQELSARLGVSHVVKFVGRQSDVRLFLAGADLGVLTSRSEGSSNSVLEYMAMGLPSVVSSIPANLELTNEVVFEAGNANDLAEKIFRLWQDEPLRERLSREYVATVSEFGLEQLTLRAQSYYSRVASHCP